MLFSKSCLYAIRACLYLAASQSDRYISIKQLSRELDISFHFLTKILQLLTQEEILRSLRGPNGGVTLARPKNEISLMDIVVAVDGPRLFDQCFLGLPGCSQKKPCPLHTRWAPIRSSLQSMLQQASLDTLSQKVITAGLRLSDKPSIAPHRSGRARALLTKENAKRKRKPL